MVSQGPKATRRPETCQAWAWGGAWALGDGISLQAAFLPHPSPMCPSRPGLTSKSKQGNSEGFLELAPRGLSVLGRSKREGGAEKGREESGGQTKGRPPLKLSLTQAREGGG